jgi:hypothetical protein
MNKTLLNLSACLFLSISAYCQMIPNYSFENWTDNLLYEEPSDILTTNAQSFFLTDGQTHINQVPGRLAGTSAIRMEVNETIIFGLPPICFLGDLQNIGAGGIPFTGQPDSLVGHFRYELSPEDTFSLIVLYKFRGNPIAFTQMTLTDTSDGFERIAIPTGPFIVSPDTIVFAMGISIIEGTATLGDFVEIDDLTFINSGSQLPNNEFEEWDLLQYQDPNGWATTNLFSAISRSDRIGTSRTTDAYEGNFAARLEVVEYEFFGFRDTAGTILTADINAAREGFPFTGGYNTLSFYYKFMPALPQNDHAVVSVVMRKEGLDIGEFIMFLDPADEYTKAEVFIAGLTEIPDTCVIAIAPGVVDTVSFNSVLGSTMYVDNFQFENMVNTQQYESRTWNGTLYPNPASDFISLESADFSQVDRVDIFNINGSMVRSFQQPRGMLHVGDLNAGMYILRIRTGSVEYTAKFEKL